MSETQHLAVSAVLGVCVRQLSVLCVKAVAALWERRALCSAPGTAHTGRGKKNKQAASVGRSKRVCLFLKVRFLWRIDCNLSENVTLNNVVLNLSKTTPVTYQEEEGFPLSWVVRYVWRKLIRSIISVGTWVIQNTDKTAGVTCT